MCPLCHRVARDGKCTIQSEEIVSPIPTGPAQGAGRLCLLCERVVVVSARRRYALLCRGQELAQPRIFSNLNQNLQARAALQNFVKICLSTKNLLHRITTPLWCSGPHDRGEPCHVPRPRRPTHPRSAPGCPHPGATLPRHPHQEEGAPPQVQP